MSEQQTPDELAINNELICTKLLGWYKCEHITHIPGLFHTPAGKHEEVPSFTTWAEAGLILDQFESRAPCERVDSVNYKSAAGEQMKKLGVLLSRGELQPQDVRMAALDYVRRLP